MKKITLLILVFMSLSNANAQDECANAMGNLLENFNKVKGISSKAFDQTANDLDTYSQALEKVLSDSRYNTSSNREKIVDDIDRVKDLVYDRAVQYSFNMGLLSGLIKEIQKRCELRSK